MSQIFIFIFTFALSFSCLEGCTGIRLTAQDGASINGRTLEFGIPVKVDVAVVPRNYEYTATLPDGKGLVYKVKYAAIGAMTFDSNVLMDGLNEKGLAVGTFYFPGFAGYSTITSENKSKALSPIDFPNWILTQFATLDEVKAGLKNVVIAPTIIKAWGTSAPPFHYVVYDKTGKSIVIEPVAGNLIVHDNPIGVCTNSPDFNWHMTNIRNYINLSPDNPKPLKVDGLELTSFGLGAGYVGIPGDFSPPSRFVRAAIYSITAIPSNTAKEAIYQVFHILNQFDIPKGLARETLDGVVYSDYTQMTSVKDPNALKYYFKTYADQNIRFVDLSKFDLSAKEIKKASTDGSQDSIDFTGSLK